MKTMAAIAALLTLLTAGVLWWLHDNAGTLLRDAMQSHGSRMIGAEVTVAEVRLSARSGQGEISGLVIGNPTGFQSPHALKVARISIALDPLTLARDVIHVRRIEVIAPDVSYEQGDGQTNFDALMKNISNSLGTERSGSQSSKRLIVDAFDLTNASAAATTRLVAGRTIGITLPDIHLKDIGKDKGGVTPGELGQIIAGAMKRKLSGAHHFDQALKATGDTLNKAGSAIKGLFK